MKHRIVAAITAAVIAAPGASFAAHYQVSQAMSGGECASDSCTMSFPVVAVGKTLLITHVTCLYVDDNADYFQGTIKVIRGSGVKHIQQLAPTFVSGGGRFVIAQPVSILVEERQRPEIRIQVSNGAGSPEMNCSIAGEMN